MLEDDLLNIFTLKMKQTTIYNNKLLFIVTNPHKIFKSKIPLGFVQPLSSAGVLINLRETKLNISNIIMQSSLEIPCGES